MGADFPEVQKRSTSEQDPKISKRRKIDPRYPAVRLPIPSIINTTYATSHGPGLVRQSPAPGAPFLQQPLRTTANVSSSERGSLSTTSQGDEPIDGNAHKSFDRLAPASSYRSNVTNEAHGSSSSPGLQSDDLQRALSQERPDSPHLLRFSQRSSEAFGTESDMGSAANTGPYTTEYLVAPSEPNMEPISSNSISYIPGYPVPRPQLNIMSVKDTLLEDPAYSYSNEWVPQIIRR